MALQVTPKGLRFLASGLRTPPLSNVKDSLSLCLSQRVDCQDMVSLGDMIQHNPQVKARTPGSRISLQMMYELLRFVMHFGFYLHFLARHCGGWDAIRMRTTCSTRRRHAVEQSDFAGIRRCESLQAPVDHASPLSEMFLGGSRFARP